MASTQQIRNLIVTLLSDELSVSQQFCNVVQGLSILKSNNRLRAGGAQHQEHLERFLTGWSCANVESERLVTQFDIALVSEFLKSAEQGAVLAEARTADLDSLGWADQLRFSTIALLAVHRPSSIAAMFDLYDSALTEDVCKKVFEIKTKAVIEKLVKAYSNERALAETVADLLQRLLSDRRYTAEAMLSALTNDVDPGVKKLRFATIAALARLAVLQSKS